MKSAFFADLIATVGLPLLIASLVAAAASLITRFHRARDRERQQLEWLAYAGVLAMITFPVDIVIRLLWTNAPAVQISDTQMIRMKEGSA
jgi:hypothetical protein